MARITIIGAGSFGLALGVTFKKSGHEITVWTPSEEEQQMILKDGENKARLR
jgi:glycerol-3-phosphate dehydrogenase (NAD(P)+)